MKGLFIPGITAEMFRNGCLESIETLMAEGEIYDADYSPWISCSERLPEEPKPNKELEGKPLDIYLVCKSGNIPFRAFWNGKFFTDGWTTLDVDAWMPLPTRYESEVE